MYQYLLEAAAANWTKASITPGRSLATRWTADLIATLALTTSVLASVTTWLLVTDPVTVSSAISTGNAEVLLRVIGTTLIHVLRILVGYL